VSSADTIEEDAPMSTTHTIFETPIGALTLVAREGALAGIWFPGHRPRPDPATFGERADHGFEEVERQLGEYLDGRRARFDLPTAVAGNPFQRRVWELIARIPYGRTATYGALAREAGRPGLARAVGRAVGANPLSIVCPCHRVVGSDGRLTGYAGGLDRKRRLLEIEAAAGDLSD
jgi:methylated-DNA-[protein]-cysteine S-methyltransferase